MRIYRSKYCWFSSFSLSLSASLCLFRFSIILLSLTSFHKNSWCFISYIQWGTPATLYMHIILNDSNHSTLSKLDHASQHVNVVKKQCSKPSKQRTKDMDETRISPFFAVVVIVVIFCVCVCVCSIIIRNACALLVFEHCFYSSFISVHLTLFFLSIVNYHTDTSLTLLIHHLFT